MRAQQHGRPKKYFFFPPDLFLNLWHEALTAVRWADLKTVPQTHQRAERPSPPRFLFTEAVDGHVRRPFPGGGHMMEEAALMPCGWLSSWTLSGRSHHASWVSERLWGPFVVKSRLSRRWEHFWSSAPWACGGGSIPPRIFFFFPERKFFSQLNEVEAGDERSSDHVSNQEISACKNSSLQLCFI